MTLWLMAAALTVAVLILIWFPVWRRSQSADQAIGEYEHDVAVYRHQLSELEIETERGIISEADSAQARTEIARRLIAAEDKAKKEREKRSGGQQQFANIFLISMLAVFVPAVSYIIYSGVGSPQLRAQPLAARLEVMREAEQQAQQSQTQMADLVARAEAHLASNPEDGQGWSVLAPVYFRAGQPDKAAEAYSNALRLLGEAPERLSGYGEALWALASGIVTDEARASFERALVLAPNEPRARFYLGLAQLQNGQMNDGRAIWTKLASETSADRDWVASAQEGLRRLDSGEANTIPGLAQSETTPPAAPGMPELDQQTIEDATQMDAGAQSDMIGSMVARLDARLRENPDDVEGWKRLLRAQVVLKDQDAAADALNRALEAFKGKDDIVRDILVFAAQLGLKPPETQ